MRKARGDVVRIESFRRQLGKRVAVAEVPNFDSDLHDIRGLERMHPFLFPGAETPGKSTQSFTH